MPRVIEKSPDYANKSGEITNLLLEPCNGVSVIKSYAGSRRSSHYHKTDSHWLYVLSGVMEYYERPVGSTAQPTKYIVPDGCSIHTAPMMEHWTVFPADTVLISMSALPRSHEIHEADLVRVPWF